MRGAAEDGTLSKGSCCSEDSGWAAVVNGGANQSRQCVIEHNLLHTVRHHLLSNLWRAIFKTEPKLSNTVLCVRNVLNPHLLHIQVVVHDVLLSRTSLILRQTSDEACAQPAVIPNWMAEAEQSEPCFQVLKQTSD